VREALAVLEPLLEKPSGDPTVDGRAFVAYALALMVIDRLDEAIAAADRAVAIASDPTTRALSVGQRGIVHTFRGDHEASVRDSQEATTVARGIGPAALSGALMFEAQARLYAGELDLAAQRLEQAEHVGAPVDAKLLWSIETINGDLAMSSGRPQEALGHYARSLEAAQARGDGLQVLFDLLGVATAFAVLREDADALEVVGLAKAQGVEVGGPSALTVAHLMGRDSLVAAEERVGPARALELTARGHAVPAGTRVSRACQLARARQLA
jgi:tetratricopeptide (TPR) repeat protein